MLNLKLSKKSGYGSATKHIYLASYSYAGSNFLMEKFLKSGLSEIMKAMFKKSRDSAIAS